MKIKIDLGFGLDIGKNPKKKNQEDYILFKTALAEMPRGLFIVNDGIGGESAGEIASFMAAHAIEASLSELFLEPEPNFEFIELKIKKALVGAHANIFENAQNIKEHQGMGTTTVLLYLDGNKAYWSWAGNSRLYRLSDSGLELLTKDQDQFRLAKEAGLYEEADKFTTLKGLMGQFGLMQALGDSVFDDSSKPKELKLSVQGEELSEGKFLYLLCSDGLHSTFPDSASEIPSGEYEKGILEFCWPYLEGTKMAQTLADEIMAAALQAEVQDNIAIILIGIEIKEEEEPTKRRAVKLSGNLKEEI